MKNEEPEKARRHGSGPADGGDEGKKMEISETFSRMKDEKLARTLSALPYLHPSPDPDKGTTVISEFAREDKDEGGGNWSRMMQCN